MVKSSTPIKPWVRTILIFPAFLIVVGFFEWLGYVLQGLDPAMELKTQTPVQLAIGALFSLIGTLLVVWFFIRRIDKIKFKDLGFDTKGSLRQLLAGFLLGLLLISSGFIVLLLFQEIRWQDTHFVFSYLMAEIVLFLMVAFSEEILLRGYVLNNLMQSMNKAWALLLSSFMFSFVHVLNPDFSWIAFVDIFLAGILLGIPYAYTRQLWFPIALHFSWNFFQGPIFGFHVSGIEMDSLIQQTRSADTIWNGGAFGLEGSVICLIFQLLAILGLWYYYTKRLANPTQSNIVTPLKGAEI